MDWVAESENELEGTSWTMKLSCHWQWREKEDGLGAGAWTPGTASGPLPPLGEHLHVISLASVEHRDALAARLVWADTTHMATSHPLTKPPRLYQPRHRVQICSQHVLVHLPSHPDRWTDLIPEGCVPLGRLLHGQEIRSNGPRHAGPRTGNYLDLWV